jgi:hypothetical protein
MNLDPLVAALAVVALVLTLANCANNFRARRSPPMTPGGLGAEPPVTQSCRHIWLITAHEETAGHPRIVYRCSECGALEVREVL